MKFTTRTFVVSALAALISGGAIAGGTSDVGTRSKADMEADLMRTYQSPGGPSSGGVGTRSEAGSYGDLMRDWDGKLAAKPGTIIGTVSPDPLILKGGSKTLQDFEFARR
jgi:hypothetical protein